MTQRMKWASLVTMTTLALLLLGCEPSSRGDASQASQTLLSPCVREAGKVPAVSGAECGYLSVPLQQLPNNTHTDTTSADSGVNEHIDVFIKRWPAISSAPKADPLFVIAGGPGQSAADVADQLAGAFYELRKKRDIVFVDQRGTGNSNPLQCELDESAQLLTSSAAATAASIEQYRACAQKHAAYAAYYTTPEAVADLESVRQALGYNTINLWGGSYGTRVILAYLAAHPSALRAVVMDGVAPVQMAMPHNIAQDATRALGLIAQQCLAKPECAERYGDVSAAANKTAAQLRAAPVTLTLEHPLTGLPTQLLLDDSKLAGLVRFSLYNRLISRLLPAALAASAEQNYRLLASLITSVATSGDQPDIALGMHMTILCSEDAKATASSPNSRELFLGVDLAAPVMEICEFWPSAEMAEAYYQPITSDVPALLLSGERDPITPPHWAERIARGFTNATSVVAPGAHHGVTRAGCASAVITEFIEHTELSDGSTKCMADIQPLAPYLSPLSDTEEAL